eukprot:GHVU01073663.1.p1 GENE.GHVU01073663.1~~GHVU01073663.1.p1  ORF type:complete len:121 (+),score=6.76 GHVU01073663.1:552-914(+)
MRQSKTALATWRMAEPERDPIAPAGSPSGSHTDLLQDTCRESCILLGLLAPPQLLGPCTVAGGTRHKRLVPHKTGPVADIRLGGVRRKQRGDRPTPENPLNSQGGKAANAPPKEKRMNPT